MLQSALHDADSGVWRAMAHCAQEPGCDVASTWLASRLERAAARAAARARFEARLAACSLLQEHIYAPVALPEQFSPDVDNPWVALVPGRTLVYAKRTSEGVERIRVTTSHRIVEIAGVRCREVQSVQRVDGVLTEDTREWFAQHADGSVWCFGESVRYYEAGFLAGIDGSWRAGSNGARPGMLVPADIHDPRAFRRALAIGTVEDVRRVAAVDTTVSVPVGDFGGAIQVEEFDPLEALELILEILVPGLGLVAEVDQNSGERLELIAIEYMQR